MRVLDYIFAARPLLHLPIWSVYLVCLHYHLNLTGGDFAATDLIMLAALSVMASSAYYFNQIYDRESDRQNRKVLFLQQGVMTEMNLRTASLTTALVSLIAAAWFSLQMLAVFATLFLMGYLYSAPPLRLKDRPFWGLFANAFGFGFLIPFTVMPHIDVHNAGLLGWDTPFYFFLTIGGVYVLTTLPDRDGDRATGKRTVAVVLSRPMVLLVALVLMLGAVWVAYQRNQQSLAYLASIASLLILGAVFVRNQKFEHLAIKLPVLMLTLLAAWFFWGYLLFVVAMLIICRIYYYKRFDMIYPKMT